MSPRTETRSAAVASRFSRAAGLVVVAGGGLVLAGWALESDSLKSLAPGLATMKANTAVAFVASGLALHALAGSPPRRSRPRRLALAGAALVVALGAVSLYQDAAGRDVGVDQLLVGDPAGAGTGQAPGRMAPATAFGFLLGGGALWLLDARRAAWPGQALAIGTLLCGLLAAAGYLHGVAALYGVGPFSSVAPHTAAAFVVLGAGILAARPRQGLMSILTADSAGGAMARRLLPAAVVLPLLPGGLRLLGQRLGAHDDVFGMAVWAWANVVVLAGALLWGASWLHRTDAARRRAADSLQGSMEQVRASEERFRLAVESAPSAMILVDGEGRIVLVNEQTERMFGHGRAELLGKPVELLVPVRFRDRHPAYRGAFLAAPAARAMGVGRDLRAQHRDGSEFPVEIGLTPVATERGLLVLAAVVDITGRKRAEDALRAAEAQYHDLYEYAPDMYVSVDAATGCILRCNHAVELATGFAREEVVGRPVLDMYHPESRARAARALDRFAATGEVPDLELQLVRKDGVVIDVSLSMSAVRDAGGRIAQSRAIWRDVTERRRADREIRRLNEELEQRVRERTAELEAANRELEAFSYSVSHDLRAPLRAIDGFSRILLREHERDLPGAACEYLADIRENTRQMGRLVDDLLTFSRLGRQPVGRQVVDPAGLVSRCLDELRAQREGRRVEIRVGDLPACLGDPALLKQVWLNLLDNALKYSARRGAAVVELGGRDGDRAGERTYFVKDNGVGFDMRYAHKLFGVFQRLHRAEDYEGTGVGLAIVQRIVQRHGGRVWAEAVPDQGATFHFTLPAAEDQRG